MKIRNNFRTKKSLGQNFLKSEAALQKIIGVGEIVPSDTILEIGPGKGALTERLLVHAGKVIAVEKDRELVEFLKTKFEKEIKSRSLVLVHGDILEFEIEDFLKAKAQSLKPSAYKIIANIPYNITGAILKKFLTAQKQPERMILMVQYEVAKRIIGTNPASPGLRRAKESILSISVKAYGHPKMLMKVPARYFSPAPKVDSAIIAITNISRKLFAVQHPMLHNSKEFEEKFWQIVKKGFAHKRKKLSSNLKGLLKGKEILVEKFGNNRAENISLDDWLSLIS